MPIAYSYLHTKRLSAATRTLGIGICEDKLGAQPVRDKIHLRSDNVHHTFPVHEDSHAVRLHFFVEASLHICMTTTGGQHRPNAHTNDEHERVCSRKRRNSEHHTQKQRATSVEYE